jgi:hypothetical protein
MSETAEWVQRVRAAILPLVPKTFVGSIEVHCFLGGVANVVIKQSFKEENAK